MPADGCGIGKATTQRRDEVSRNRAAEYVPTADQRALVENAAAFGLTQADIAEQLGIQEKTLRKHFRRELNGGKFKVDMLAGKTVTELMKDKDARVRLEAAKYYTARRMGWKETNVNEQVGKEQSAARGFTALRALPILGQFLAMRRGA